MESAKPSASGPFLRINTGAQNLIPVVLPLIHKLNFKLKLPLYLPHNYPYV